MLQQSFENEKFYLKRKVGNFFQLNAYDFT